MSFIHQVEQRKLQELREATAATFLGTLCLSELKDRGEMFVSFVRTHGRRGHLLQALKAPGSPLQGLDDQLRALLAVNVNLTEEAGQGYLKAPPLRRSQRRSLLRKRWIVKLFEREEDNSESIKIAETDQAVSFNVNVHRSKGFSLKGGSPAFRALMWAACRGQLEGLIGAPPSNSYAELCCRQLLLWMVAKEGARLHRQLSPYLTMTLDPDSSFWKSALWQGFQREYQIRVSQMNTDGDLDSYCAATNMELCCGEDVGWGPGVEVFSKPVAG